MEKVFYIPGQPWIVDFAVARKDGVIVSEQQGITFSELKNLYPSAVMIDYKEAVEQIENRCKTEPRQINAEDYYYALEVFPLEQRTSGGDFETFKMSQRTNGRVTAIYARIGNSYWMFQDVYSLNHLEIIARVRTAQQMLNQAVIN
jgi:hypothetical protein